MAMDDSFDSDSEQETRVENRMRIRFVGLSEGSDPQQMEDYGFPNRNPRFTEVTGVILYDTLAPDGNKNGHIWVEATSVSQWDVDTSRANAERSYRSDGRRFGVSPTSGSEYQVASEDRDGLLERYGHLVELEEIDDGALDPYHERGTIFEVNDVEDVLANGTS